MMKKILTILSASLLLAACAGGDYSLKDPTLEVSAPSVVKVGQTVEFTLSGEQDVLSFWSGEAGNDLAYRNTDRIGAGDTWMSFSCTTSSGTSGYPNPSVVPISWSKDFTGEYTKAAMDAATWHDITSAFDWPGDTGVSSHPAGELALNDILPEDGTPVYFRYYYRVAAYDASAGGGKGNGRTQWSIAGVRIFCDTSAGEITAYDMYDQMWQFIMGDGCGTIPEANLPQLPTTTERILFRSQYKPAVDINMWAVSGPISRPGDLNLGRDKGVGIKTLADPQMRKYYYTYNTPGTYKVAFVGVNASVEGRKEIVREVELKVVQDTGNIAGPGTVEW